MDAACEIRSRQAYECTVRQLPPRGPESRDFRCFDAGENELRRVSQSSRQDRERMHYLSHVSRNSGGRNRFPRVGRHVEANADYRDSLAVVSSTDFAVMESRSAQLRVSQLGLELVWEPA